MLQSRLHQRGDTTTTKQAHSKPETAPCELTPEELALVAGGLILIAHVAVQKVR